MRYFFSLRDTRVILLTKEKTLPIVKKTLDQQLER
jgi:hypothetical protein